MVDAPGGESLSLVIPRRSVESLGPCGTPPPGRFLFCRRTPMSATAIRNEAGGQAFAFGPRHALAQLAATGCLSNTYYASGEQQLDKVLTLAEQVEPPF